jgi:hypothetical protein
MEVILPSCLSAAQNSSLALIHQSEEKTRFGLWGFCISPQKIQSRISVDFVHDPLPLDAQRFLLPQEVLRRRAAQLDTL